MKAETAPSAAARRVARILLDERATLNTAYGKKTATGIADLIDRETKAPLLPEMAEALRDMLTAFDSDTESPDQRWAREVLAKYDAQD